MRTSLVNTSVINEKQHWSCAMPINVDMHKPHFNSVKEVTNMDAFDCYWCVAKNSLRPGVLETAKLSLHHITWNVYLLPVWSDWFQIKGVVQD